MANLNAIEMQEALLSNVYPEFDAFDVHPFLMSLLLKRIYRLKILWRYSRVCLAEPAVCLLVLGLPVKLVSFRQC